MADPQTLGLYLSGLAEADAAVGPSRQQEPWELARYRAPHTFPGMAGARQTWGAGTLPIGVFEYPDDGNKYLGLGLPQGGLDLWRSLRQGLGYEQDPTAPAGYVSENSMLKGALGGAGLAMTGTLPAGLYRGYNPRILTANGASPVSRESLQTAIKKALADDEYYYGIRVNDPDAGHPILKPGDKAQESRQWYQDYDSDARWMPADELSARYPGHNEPLGGTSTYALTSENALEQALHNYYGTNISLVKSGTRIRGADPNEWILPDADVVAVWNK